MFVSFLFKHNPLLTSAAKTFTLLFWRYVAPFSGLCLAKMTTLQQRTCLQKTEHTQRLLQWDKSTNNKYFNRSLQVH